MTESAMTADEAAKVIAAERAAREKACGQALDAVLAEHRCRLEVAVLLRATAVEPMIKVVSE